MPDIGNTSSAQRSVRVWDLPVRLFHWLIVALLLLSFITGHVGGNAMRIHELSGFSILTLVLFRLLWGFFGSTHARFADFVRGITAARSYAAALWSGRSAFHIGHNPIGGWMVLALLLCLLLQATTGLFANDDIMTEGPLVRLISKELSDRVSLFHQINSYVLAVLVTLHIIATLYYLWRKRENLILPMVTGRKLIPAERAAEDFRGGGVFLAAALLAICAVVVWVVVR
jgi:cytochrome b